MEIFVNLNTLLSPWSFARLNSPMPWVKHRLVKTNFCPIFSQTSSVWYVNESTARSWKIHRRNPFKRSIPIFSFVSISKRVSMLGNQWPQDFKPYNFFVSHRRNEISSKRFPQIKCGWKSKRSLFRLIHRKSLAFIRLHCDFANWFFISISGAENCSTMKSIQIELANVGLQGEPKGRREKSPTLIC